VVKESSRGGKGALERLTKIGGEVNFDFSIMHQRGGKQIGAQNWVVKCFFRGGVF